MRLLIGEEMINQFLSGLLIVLLLLSVGFIIATLLRFMAKRHPFSRLGIILATTPLSMLHFIEKGMHTPLLIYAMVMLLLGVTVDAIAYLLEPRSTPDTSVESQSSGTETTSAAAEEEDSPKPNVLVWEKAE